MAKATLEDIDPMSAGVWTCSKCGNEMAEFWDDYPEKPDYCSNCGVKFSKWDSENSEIEI